MMKNITYGLITLLACTLILSGCAKWLDVKPNNEQSNDDFWNTKEEVEAVMNGSYTALRRCIQRILQWSELRGDGVDIGPGQSNAENWLMIKDLEIRPTNEIVKWVNFYNVINRCNSVIAYAPTVMSVDNTFTKEHCDKLIAEATWLRTLCYFYLVRTFWDVPFITEPYLDDERDYRVPKTDGDKILEHLAQDLLSILDDITITYPSDSWQLHGRATIYSAYALLADIYLWQGNYPEAAKYCQYVMNSGIYELVTTTQWYTLYYPGNSMESIFEIQWDQKQEQSNDLYAWTHGNDNNTNAHYKASEVVANLFSEEEGTDRRGQGGSFLASMRIWKYAGTSRGGDNTRPTEERDANFILYRLADVMLMRAEALIMMGGSANFGEAHDLMVEIRERAGLEEHLDMPERESDALDLLLEERLRELCFEGKRWYDLVRIAIRDDARYKNKLITILLRNVPAADRPLYQSKLNNVYSYFLPIHEDDIVAGGGILVQNPYCN